MPSEALDNQTAGVSRLKRILRQLCNATARWIGKKGAVEQATDAVPDSQYDLVAICTDARHAGQDFATIWESVLKHHPLVAGIPVPQMAGNQPVLRIRLRTGQHLQFDHYGFSLV